jgi:hypothetical protein
LGATAARLPRPRGLALRPLPPADRQGTPLGREPRARPARQGANRAATASDRGSGGGARRARQRAAPPRARRRSSARLADDLGCRADPRLPPARRDRRRAPLPPCPPARPRRRARPVVIESADNKRRGRLSKAGSPQLRWALVEAAQHACRSGSPDLELYQSVRERADAQRATLTASRKIARRCYHTLNAAAPTPA